MKTITLENSKGEQASIPLEGFEILEGSENGHAGIWWSDENGDRHSMTTKATTKEVGKMIDEAMGN